MLRQLPLVLLAAYPAFASFSLNTVVKDYWYYVNNHLAASTSEACLAAYSAAIDCDQTLLGIVASGSPNFNPGPTDLERTCTTTCQNSLDAYVENVKKACTASGDGALVSSSQKPRPQVPVSVVGEVFQYDTSWCYLDWFSDPNYARAQFPCSSTCSMAFFDIAHKYPGSNYTFRVYELENQSSWWLNQFAGGWKTVEKCKGNSDDETGTTIQVTRTRTSSTKSRTTASSTGTSTSQEENESTHSLSLSQSQTITSSSEATDAATTTIAGAASSSTSAPGSAERVGGDWKTLFALLSLTGMFIY